MPTALVTALMLAAANVTAAESQRHVHLCGQGVEVAARGKGNSVVAHHGPAIQLRQFLDCPRRLRLVTWREDSGCPNNGSKINGLDLESTASSSPSVNSVPTRLPARPSRAISTGQPNQWLKNVGIVFRYLAENTVKHPSRSSRQVNTSLTFIVVTTSQSLTYATSAGSLVSASFFAENETRNPLTITYSTGIKKRLRTVENNMPPTIAVPTECRPSLPAPVAK
jgi:hypothetical protein